MNPVAWIETDESLIVCAGCPHPLAEHVEATVGGWWPCLNDDCPCPNFTDANGCTYCHGKRWVTDENGYEHNCGMCS